jgi:hypothetical protein
MMPNTDLPGGDFWTKCDDGVCHKPPSACQALCDASAKCKLWALVPGSRCCLKGDIPHLNSHTGMASGVKDPNAPTPQPQGLEKEDLSPALRAARARGSALR